MSFVQNYTAHVSKPAIQMVGKKMAFYEKDVEAAKEGGVPLPGLVDKQQMWTQQNPTTIFSVCCNSVNRELKHGKLGFSGQFGGEFPSRSHKSLMEVSAWWLLLLVRWRRAGGKDSSTGKQACFPPISPKRCCRSRTRPPSTRPPRRSCGAAAPVSARREAALG